MTVRVNEAIESSLRRFGIVRKVRRSQAVHIWDDIVGPTTAKVSAAVTCRDGVLFVEVKNSVWAAELSLMKRDIIRRLNQRLGRGTIKDIRFRATGRSFHQSKTKPDKNKHRTDSAIRKQALSSCEITKLKESALDIRDPELQSAFVRFAITVEETRPLRDSLSRG